MEFNFNKQPNGKGGTDSFVYGKEGAFVTIAKMSDAVYAPNFSFICVNNAEMVNIKALAEQVKATGTDRVTRAGRPAKDGGNDIYNVSIITLDNGKLVDVSFKNSNHPLWGISIKWIEQSIGAVAIQADANFHYFSPTGNASFDLGFSRKKVKLGDTKFVKGTGFVTTYPENDTYMTLVGQPTSEGFARASRTMKLLEETIAHARLHMTPVESGGIDNSLMNALGANLANMA